MVGGNVRKTGLVCEMYLGLACFVKGILDWLGLCTVSRIGLASVLYIGLAWFVYCI